MRSDAVQRFRRVAGDHFHDSRQRVLAVARVDSLRRIADEKVPLPLRFGLAFEDRNADLLGGARIYRRLINDGCPLFQISPDGNAGSDQWTEIGLMSIVDRSGYSDNDDVGGAQLRSVGRGLEQRSRC